MAASGLGYQVVVADARVDNAGALRVLAACGAAAYPDGESVSVETAFPMGSRARSADGTTTSARDCSSESVLVAASAQPAAGALPLKGALPTAGHSQRPAS